MPNATPEAAHIATIGQVVWYLPGPPGVGPFAALTLTSGPTPLLLVHRPDGSGRVQPSHWAVEDGTEDGWLEPAPSWRIREGRGWVEVPASGPPPSSLWEAGR